MKTFRTLVIALVLVVLLGVSVAYAAIEWDHAELEVGHLIQFRWYEEGEASGSIFYDADPWTQFPAYSVCYYNCYSGVRSNTQEYGVAAGPILWWYDEDSNLQVTNFNDGPDTGSYGWSYAYGTRECEDDEGETITEGYTVSAITSLPSRVPWIQEITWDEDCITPFKIRLSYDGASDTCAEFWDEESCPYP